jgi:hypothetical protein
MAAYRALLLVMLALPLSLSAEIPSDMSLEQMMKGDHLPDAKCRGDSPTDGSHFVYRDEALTAIDKFCGYKPYWDKKFVSPASWGTNADGDKALAASDSYEVNDKADKLYLQVGFAEDACQGDFIFTQGGDDTWKKQTCVAHFLKILDTVRDGEHEHILASLIEANLVQYWTA